MNGMVVKRDEFFDSLKFFLISIVILGHTLEISEKTRVVLALYNTIYSFHMPLFIGISGFLLNIERLDINFSTLVHNNFKV